MLLALTLMLTADPTPEDAKLAAHFKAYLETEFRRHPAFATSQGNHDHDDRLDDLSPAARAEDLVRTREVLAGLAKAVDKSKLSAAGKIDCEIWQHALEYQLWQAANDDRFANDPRVFGEYFSDSVFTLLVQSTVPKPRAVANAAKRIALVPKVVEAAKASLKNPPKVLTEIAIARTKGAVAFYEKDVFALADETPGGGDFAAACRSAAAALKEYQKFLESELLPKSTGEWRLGPAKFAAKLELELDAGLTAADVQREAESEADRVEREMYFAAKQLWAELFPGKPLPPDDAEGRSFVTKNVLDKLGEEHGTPESLLEDTKKTVAGIKDFIRAKKILTLPDPDRCDIILMPEFQRGFSAAYLNPAPPLDPTAKSLYAVSPPPESWTPERRETFFREYNRHMLQILTIHEAYPGHYVQLDYSNRHPSLIRKVFYSGVFAEGWAVYTEQMMLDQGYGNGDLRLRLHQLKFYLRAVLNAILDYRMHSTTMSDVDAVKLLVGRGFQTEAEAVGKVARAKQSSCQLSTYFVGRTAFYRLRQSVSRARGDAFDLGKFHEEVLGNGTLPTKYLPQLVK